MEKWGNGLYIVSQKGKYGFFNTRYGDKPALNFDNIKWSDQNRNQLEVSYQGKQGLTDENYNIIFSEKDKSGLMKPDGTVLIPFKYSSIKSRNKTIYVLEKEGQFGIFDSEQEKKEIKYYEELDWCSGRDVNYKAKQNGKYGLIDEKGNTVLPFDYDELLCGEAFEMYYLSKDGKYAFVDIQKPNGMSEFIYDEIDYINRKDGTGAVRIDGKWVNLKDWKVDPTEERIVFHSPETRAYFIDCPIKVAPDSKESNCADKKMLEFIYTNVEYPIIARENGVEGVVVIAFDISPIGKLHNIRIRRDIGAGCGEATKKVVEKMPDWIPAVQDGEKVWMRFNLPVRFMLAN